VSGAVKPITQAEALQWLRDNPDGVISWEVGPNGPTPMELRKPGSSADETEPLTGQDTERSARLAEDAHREHQARIEAERREQRAERLSARWEARTKLLELRAQVAKRVLEGELDAELGRLAE